MEQPTEDFGRLEKLLKLKRYEQPPPRYFDEFPARVLARIQKESAAAPQSIWQVLGLDFNWQTALGGSALVAICAIGIWAGFGLGQVEPKVGSPTGLAGDSSGLFGNPGSAATSLRPADPAVVTALVTTGSNGHPRSLEEFPNLRISPAGIQRR